ncbi:MAG: dihydrofolate reductase [bacterium]
MIAIIAAIADNNCIGKNNKLPWHIPEDLKQFKKITANKTVLMGRKTFESILGYLGHPLPNRTNIVLTRNAKYNVHDVEVCNNVKSAIAKHQNEDIFVIGGATVYEQTINLADTLYITHIHKKIDGDAFFPLIKKNEWKEIKREDYDKFSFVKYSRIKSRI